MSSTDKHIHIRDASALGFTWRKSSHSGGGDDNGGGSCIEVADDLIGTTPVRDSKDPRGPALVFTHDAWRAFVGAVKAGEFPAC